VKPPSREPNFDHLKNIPAEFGNSGSLKAETNFIPVNQEDLDRSMKKMEEFEKDK